jgi:tetratricopeptide (TPR) repeat protein
MSELLAQHSGLVWGILLASFTVLLAGFLLMRRRRRAAGAPQTVACVPSEAAVDTAATKLRDRAALTAAVTDAEARGERGRLPGLYFLLAECHIEAGKTTDAEELLRKCIRGAAESKLKDTHAKARLVLGDLALRSGDHTTACEHWQIARALFHELKQSSEHEAAESRMLRNGCPTDWVLTDF